MRPLLLYVHGFISSSQSEKAVAVGRLLKDQNRGIDYFSPSLSNYPGEAFEYLNQLILTEKKAGRESIGLIGSSLGGYYATMLAERHQLRAVLINPAIRPHELIESKLGEHTNMYTGEQFTLDLSHLQQLVDMEICPLQRPENYWLMVQTGDESLDYRKATVYYKNSPQLIEQGGNHRFENFEQHLPEVLSFLDLT